MLRDPNSIMDSLTLGISENEGSCISSGYIPDLKPWKSQELSQPDVVFNTPVTI